jgi:tetratricopeptide (TPR) repeat protein
LLAVLSVALYAGTLDHGFPFDDEVHVRQNLEVRDLGRAARAFGAPTWPGNLYRPLATFSYGLTHAVAGLDARAYHATNVALNAAVVAIAFLCLARLVAPDLAFVTALLFALHPLHVETVASIANRTELLAALFGLAAVLAVLPRTPEAPAPGWLRALAAGASLLLALLAKESALVFLPLAVLCLWIARRGDVSRLRGDLPALLGLGVAVAAYLGLRIEALGGIVPAEAEISPIDNPLVDLSAGERAVRAVVLLGKYVVLLLLPASPSADYSFGTAGLGEPLAAGASIGGLLLLGGVLAVAAAGLRRRHPTGLFAAWFLLAFAVTANVLFPIGTIFADRLAYVPSLGICGLVGWTFLQLASPPLRVGAVGLLALVWCLRTVSYGEVWKDSEAVFRYEMATSPESVKVQNGWAEALSRAGRLEEARHHFEAALAIHPGYTGAAFGLGVLALKEGDRERGERWLVRALAIDPEHVPTLVLLGRLALKRDRVDEAGRLFVRALNADNESFDARLGLLAAFLERGNLAQAEALRAELVERDPANPELRALASHLDGRIVRRPGSEAGAGGDSGASTASESRDRAGPSAGSLSPGVRGPGSGSAAVRSSGFGMREKTAEGEARWI